MTIHKQDRLYILAAKQTTQQKERRKENRNTAQIIFIFILHHVVDIMLQEVGKGFPTSLFWRYPFKSKVESHPFQPLRKSTGWWFLPCASYAPFSVHKASIEQKPHILGSYKVMRVYIQDTQFRIKRYLFVHNHSSHTLCQKESICGHSHIQWKSDPFRLLHVMHVSGISGLKWCNLAGVTYCLVSHSYCSHLECVFVVWVWAKEQAFDHSSCYI